MEVTASQDFQHPKFIYIQEASTEKKKIVKKLEYDYKLCNGCGICVDICPTKALSLGPVKEIATGLDAPAVIMDLSKCTFCGMCAVFCPIRATKMSIDGRDILEENKYPQLILKTEPNEKCLPCKLCEKVCPNQAIKVKINVPRKAEIAPLKKEGAKGSIKIDTKKCTLCGVCTEMCSAFILIEKEFKPDSPLPFESLVVDESLCDYCRMCVALCPEKAIEVELIEGREAVVEIPKKFGTIEVDQQKCTRAGWCKLVCPYDAMDLIKPFEGDIKLVERNLPKCDPIGCHACFNICPSKAWFIPKDRKINVEDKLCIYCNACSNACPYKVIAVKRSKAHTTSIPEAPWKGEWQNAIDIILGKKREEAAARMIKLEEKPVEIGGEGEGEIKVPEEIVEIKTLERGKFDEKTQQKLAALRKLLNNIKVRYLWERDTAENATAEIEKRLSAAKK
jgi:4Fe-4S ferredoxin